MMRVDFHFHTKLTVQRCDQTATRLDCVTFHLYSKVHVSGILYSRNIFSKAFPAHSGPMPLIQVCNYFSQTVGLGRVINPSQDRCLNTGQHKHRINAYTYKTSMPCVGFEPTIPASERARTVHALDRAATVTG
jgi:hypothetical protein